MSTQGWPGMHCTTPIKPELESRLVVALSWPSLSIEQILQGQMKLWQHVAAVQRVVDREAADLCQRVIDVDHCLIGIEHPHEFHAGLEILGEFVHQLLGV